jgi:hypothetical protein
MDDGRRENAGSDTDTKGYCWDCSGTTHDRGAAIPMPRACPIRSSLFAFRFSPAAAQQAEESCEARSAKVGYSALAAISEW